MRLCDLAPAHIRAISPYQPGKPISELAREMGLAEESIVKLASNENPLGVGEKTRAAMQAALADIARYPDGNGFELKDALCRRYGLKMDRIVLGNGSNDILEMAAGAFLGPDREAVFAQHAFAVYALATQAAGARGIEEPARNFGHDLDAMLAAITSATRVVFIANPNNPTGTFLSGDELEAFLERVPEQVLVVLDEAYTEYLAPAQRYDAIAWIERFPNLLVSRTFSKAYGLAGERVARRDIGERNADQRAGEGGRGARGRRQPQGAARRARRQDGDRDRQHDADRRGHACRGLRGLRRRGRFSQRGVRARWLHRTRREMAAGRRGACG